MRVQSRRVSIVLALWLTGLLPCGAQTVPAVPAPRLPQDVAREPQPAARDGILQIDQERQAEQAPPGAQSVRLQLEAIELRGNTVWPQAHFEPLWAGLLGREISLDQVFQVAARISAAYRDAGYALSQALVPQQDISQAGARVRIRVAEGHVAQIVLSADAPAAQRIGRMLAPIRAERPLTLATLERCLLLVGDLPGLRTQAVLRAGPEPDASTLELLVERTPPTYALSLHNRTAAAVGPLRSEASAERSGLFSDVDQHGLRWVSAGSRRLNLLAYHGALPLGAAGASLSWSASSSRSRPKAGELFQFDTQADSAAVGLAHPLLRSRQRNLALRATLAGYNGRSDVADGLPVSRERLRTLRLGLTADASDALGGINLLELEWVRGLSGLDASRAGDALLARAGANPQFSKTTLYAARLQSLGGEWSLLAAVSAQHSASMLTSSEMFGLGGEVFLRAYDPSELLGDRGAGAKLELRHNLALGALASTVYAFYDHGDVRQRQALGPDMRQWAAATGLGLRLSAASGLRSVVEVAKPLHRATAHRGDRHARIFAGLGVDF